MGTRPDGLVMGRLVKGEKEVTGVTRVTEVEGVFGQSKLSYKSIYFMAVFSMV